MHRTCVKINPGRGKLTADKVSEKLETRLVLAPSPA